jgi:hypothetical protein
VEPWRKRRYLRAAKRRIKNQPYQVEYKIPLRMFSRLFLTRPENRPGRTDPTTKVSVVHDPEDERFDLAIQAFNDLGYRLEREEESEALGGLREVEDAFSVPRSNLSSSRRPGMTRRPDPTTVSSHTLGFGLGVYREDPRAPSAPSSRRTTRRPWPQSKSCGSPPKTWARVSTTTHRLSRVVEEQVNDGCHRSFLRPKK